MLLRSGPIFSQNYCKGFLMKKSLYELHNYSKCIWKRSIKRFTLLIIDDNNYEIC